MCGVQFRFVVQAIDVSVGFLIGSWFLFVILLLAVWLSVCVVSFRASLFIFAFLVHMAPDSDPVWGDPVPRAGSSSLVAGSDRLCMSDASDADSTAVASTLGRGDLAVQAARASLGQCVAPQLQVAILDAYVGLGHVSAESLHSLASSFHGPRQWRFVT